jgi:hypothetical protein
MVKVNRANQNSLPRFGNGTLHVGHIGKITYLHRIWLRETSEALLAYGDPRIKKQKVFPVVELNGIENSSTPCVCVYL